MSSEERASCGKEAHQSGTEDLIKASALNYYYSSAKLVFRKLLGITFFGESNLNSRQSFIERDCHE